MVDPATTRAPRASSATWALVGAVSAIAFAAIFFRLSQPTHPIVAAGWRLVIASAVLAPWLLRARRQLSRRVVGLAIWGGVAYGIHFGAWVASLGMTSVAASVTLVTSTPLLLAVLAVFSGTDRPSGRIWFAIAIAVVGVACIASQSSSGGRQQLTGDALALLGAAAMAAYLVIGRRLGAELPVLPFMGIATAVGGVLLLATALIGGVSLWPSSPRAGLYILLAALIPQLVGHSLLTWSLRRVSPTVVGMATVGEPMGSTLLAWLLLSEIPGLRTLLGCAIIIAAMLLALSERRHLSIENSPQTAKMGTAEHHS